MFLVVFRSDVHIDFDFAQPGFFSVSDWARNFTCDFFTCNFTKNWARWSKFIHPWFRFQYTNKAIYIVLYWPIIYKRLIYISKCSSLIIVYIGVRSLVILFSLCKNSLWKQISRHKNLIIALNRKMPPERFGVWYYSFINKWNPQKMKECIKNVISK